MTLAEGRIGEDSGNLARELVDDRLRRPRRHDDAPPRRNVELAEAELGERRHVGEGAGAPRRGGGDDARAPAGLLLQRPGRIEDDEVQIAADEIGERVRVSSTPVRDARDVETVGPKGGE